MATIEEKIRQLQLEEQRLQQLLLQKQALQAQTMEIASALSELKNAQEAYKIIGNIMVAAKKEELDKDLGSRKEAVELRIASLARQETSVREKASQLQKEIVGEMKNDG